MSFPKPKESELKTALRDHDVPFVVHAKERSRNQWADGLRAATVHHTAGKNSVDYLATKYSLPGANCVIQHGGYNGKANDGKAVILAWGSAWHSGDGGPWKGVAGRDSLHLVSWGIEIESLGTKKDMTDAQIETTGRMLAALVDLGMPKGNIHRHADWTDGTSPVGGYPLPTRGRKIDTNKAWYDTAFWVKKAGLYIKPDGLWDGTVPTYEGVINAQDRGLANAQAWRLACRLADLGFFKGTPADRGVQGYPRKAVASWQASRGYEATGKYGPKAHEMLWPGEQS